MLASVPARHLDGLVADLFSASHKPRLLSALGWFTALSLHAGTFALAFQGQSSAPPAVRPPVEVEFVQPPPKALEPVAPPEPEAAPAEPKSVVRSASPKPAASPPPAAARAAALHTAKDDGSKAAPGDPLDFTHDPSAANFGGGVVAVGGTAAFASQGAAPRARPAATTASTARGEGEGLTAAADLGRKPSLGESDPCRGYFPRSAEDDVATASVLVVVSKSGAVSKVSLLSETPSSQGFGAAARACMQSKRFTPALDREGRPTATAIRVNIRFTR